MSSHSHDLSDNASRSPSLVSFDSRSRSLSPVCFIRSALSVGLALAALSPTSGFAEPQTGFMSKVNRVYPMVTPNTLALELTGIGDTQPGSALLLNPAGMSVATQYEVNGYYVRSQGGDNLMGLHAVEANAQSRFALGLGYQTRLKGGEFCEHYGILGASLSLGQIAARPVYAGIAARYVYEDATSDDVFDLDLGLLLPISSQISIGLVGRELLESFKLGAGATFQLDRFNLNFDVLNERDSNWYETRGALQILANRTLTVRVGYRHLFTDDQSGGQSISGGVGLFGIGGGRGRIDISYTQALTDDSYLFGLGIQGFLNSQNTQSPQYY